MTTHPAPERPFAALERARASAALVAGLLSAAIGLRFVGHAAVRGVVVPVPGPRPEQFARPNAASAPPVVSPPAISASATVPLGAPVRVTLVVTAGPERSEVFVNRASVGHAPFMGDVTCRAGDRLRVELMPPSGAPRTYDRMCMPGTLRIE